MDIPSGVHSVFRSGSFVVRRTNFRVIVLALVLLASCSGKYVYLPPAEISTLPLEAYSVNDLLPYCTLRVEHFQADEPPAGYRSMERRIGALTVIVVCAPAGIVIDPVEVPSNPDSARWEATVESLTWEAFFYTKGSWWNPKNKDKVVLRFLEHEQGHFAIARQEVLKENALAAETLQRTWSTGPTHEAVVTEASKRLKIEQKRVNDRILAWQAKYDFETKNGTDKKAQRRWTARLQTQLREMD